MKNYNKFLTKNLQIAYIRNYFAIGVGGELISLFERNKRWTCLRIKIMLGPVVINYSIHGKKRNMKIKDNRSLR